MSQFEIPGYGPICRPLRIASERKSITPSCIKIYGVPTPDESRYSPATCIGCEMKTGMGDPDPHHVSTSYVERQNLTMRMSMSRFTRLTNGFLKKLENHGHMVALHFMHYNFARVHKSLRITPAMAAGISDHVWSLKEIAMLADDAFVPTKRGPYKKQGGE